MEFPQLGIHCALKSCNRLDFLPFKCIGCSKSFCNHHYSFDSHSCPERFKFNVEVPVCPICNNPVPIPRGESPDIKMNEHLDQNCKKQAENKVFTYRCKMVGCKRKEAFRVVCKNCQLNYCLTHRHMQDHDCSNVSKPKSSNVAKPSSAQQLDEDEELARAIQMSLYESQTQVQQPTRGRNDKNCNIS